MPIKIQLLCVAQDEMSVLLELVWNLGENCGCRVVMCSLVLIFRTGNLHVEVMGSEGLNYWFSSLIITNFLQASQQFLSQTIEV